MFKLRNLGLLLASLVAALAILGATALIALDFVGVDGLARVWSAIAGPSASVDPSGRARPPTSRRLRPGERP